MRIAFLLLLFLAACSEVEQSSNDTVVKKIESSSSMELVPMMHAETFKVYQRGSYRVIDLQAPLVSWGGTAQGSEIKARIVLVPKGTVEPELTGDLEGATVIKTPVERIATNYSFLEAILSVLEEKQKIVAVGGVKSYEDDIRAKARAGEIAQIGYGWHMPPMIDPLINSKPDVFLMVMGSMEHSQHLERIRGLGVPVIPVFHEAETDYMGPVDYVRLVGMLTDKETQAIQFVEMVESNVSKLKKLASSVEPKKVLSAWYSGAERWMVTVRNADNALLEDAGGINPLAKEDDINIDDFVKLSSETLLEQARDIDCWIIRDSHSKAFTDTKFLKNFKAWRNGCLFASDGSAKKHADAFDIYATGLIRPDLILRDIVQMLHPELIKAEYKFVQPDNQTPRP